MRLDVIASLVFACAVPALSAQTAPTTPAPSQDQKSPSKPLTLSGCVQGLGGTDQYTLWDPTPSRKEAPVYRLSGVELKLFAGHRVRVVGGLVPSTNVAAQAGALGPPQSSMVSVGGVNAGGNPVTPAGTTPLPELRVKSIKLLTGTCPP